MGDPSYRVPASTKHQKAQLVAAGKLWDGKALPVERRLSPDENDEAALGAVLEHVVIGDATGKAVYDAWLYAGDSGAFFRAGTTTLIADRIQDAMQMKGKGNEALADALSGIGYSEKAHSKRADIRAATLAGLAAKQVRTEKAPTKKKTAPKKPAKKAPTKPAKKAPTKKR